jgi:hypothetical protein
MARPDSIPEGVKTLSSNVWVRDVDGPTLAVLVPLLERALTERGTTVQRQTVILIGNLFKLVRSNKLAAKHLPALYPGVHRIVESASFPEIRELAKEAELAMTEAAHGATASAATKGPTAVTEDEKLALEIISSLVAKATGEKPDEFMQTSLRYVAFAVASLVRKRSFDETTWVDVYLVPYLARFMAAEQAQTVAKEVRKRWIAIDKVRFLPCFLKRVIWHSDTLCSVRREMSRPVVSRRRVNLRLSTLISRWPTVACFSSTTRRFAWSVVTDMESAVPMVSVPLSSLLPCLLELNNETHRCWKIYPPQSDQSSPN